MAIGIGEDHDELRRTVQRWAEARIPRQVPRALLDAENEELPSFWSELAGQGWLGIHVPEEHGGHGFGLLEAAIVVEELARACAPGPVSSTMAAAAAIAAADDPAAKVLLPLLADGSRPCSLALGTSSLTGRRLPDGAVEVSGNLRPVQSATTSSLCLVSVPVEGEGEGAVWCAVDLGAPQATTSALTSLDLTRRVGSIELSGAVVGSDHQLPSLTGHVVRRFALALAAAECAGGSRWCLDNANEYAKQRRQFGRLIGQFQAVKHRLADMLVAVEQVTALAWDAALSADSGDDDQAALSAVMAGAACLDAYVECAKGCVQLHGGMGFTWEHDSHLHLRRSLAMRQLHGGTNALRVDAARAALAGGRRRFDIGLPADAEGLRAEVRALVRQVADAQGTAAKRAKIVETGLLTPHWPQPWGRGSGPLEQLVIDEEMAAAGVFRPSIAVGTWALPTIIAHGSEAQKERFVKPTLLGELTWCQLFSEPGAGSDLASLSMRAVRGQDGWLLTGQKVWTSMAQKSDWGICLARSDVEAPKHAGITYFLVDMRSPGIEVRPLREMTGDAMFNEVFFTDVFVPDECVVGQVNDGWRLARTTLENERVSMSSGASFGFGVEWILGTLANGPHADDQVVLDEVGGLMAEAHSVAALGARTTLRSVSGVEPGSEASVRKLLGAEHEQRVQELGLVLLGPEGATTEGEAQQWSRGFLSTRCLTIAGGTSEVQRNVIAERMLGLPRDPEPGS